MAGAPLRWRCSGYAGVLLLKLFRVPAGRWTITTEAPGGVVIVGVLLLAMNYNHPFTTEARLRYFTTLIIPEIKGRVVEVPVKPYTPLKKGDVLFKIYPQPYQFVVAQKEAAIIEVEQGAKELRASLD